MKTIIAGSRGIEDIAVVAAAVEASGFRDRITEVVSGAARGVDRLGEQWAASVGIPVKSCPADWKRQGRGAGLVRNREMADYADALIAIWDGKSRGTRNMIELAEARGLKVFVHVVEGAGE
jgi:hypothetical protein